MTKAYILITAATGLTGHAAVTNLINPRKIVKEQTMAAILRQSDELAEQGLAQLKTTSDKAFAEQWQATQGGKVMFSGTRYRAYRNIAVNHMIHHRGSQAGARLVRIIKRQGGPAAYTCTRAARAGRCPRFLRRTLHAAL